TATSGTATIAAGSTSTTFNVSTTDDNISELTETFFVTLTTPTNATIANSQGIGTITDNDAIPTMSVPATRSYTEGSGANNGYVLVPITLSRPSSQTITVQWRTQATGVTTTDATPDLDYDTSTGIATFEPGDTTVNLRVFIKDDNIHELSETFRVVISGAAPGSAVNVANNQSDVSIIANDAVPTLTVSSPTVVEGNSGTTTMNFVLSLSNPTSANVVFNYKTTDGTAVSPADFVAIASTAGSIPALSTSVTIPVTINGDLIQEGNEQFTLDISGATNVAAATAQGTGTIQDDDDQPTISVDDVTVTEGNSGTVNAVFNVTLSHASSSP